MDEPVVTLVRFAHALRSHGVPVDPARIHTFCKAAAALPPADLYWAGRASLVARREHIRLYDEAFSRFFFDPPDSDSEAEDGDAAAIEARPAHIVSSRSGDELRSGTQPGTASSAELLHEKSFEACTDQDRAALAELLSRLPLTWPMRRTRRYRRGGPGRLHARAALRRAARTGGEPVELPQRRRRMRERPLLFVLDVSGSMAAYAQGLLLFSHALLRAGPSVEVYAFATRLTQLTPSLRTASPDEAIRAAGHVVRDWDGGTRIGDAIAELLERSSEWGTHGRPIAVICSDGLDTGDPAVLGEQLARLRRRVHHVVWLNPLKEDPAYEPLAQGMREALPNVDVFESGHSLGALLAVFHGLRAGA